MRSNHRLPPGATPPALWPSMSEAIPATYGHYERDPATGTQVYVAGPSTRRGLPGVVYEPTPEERATQQARLDRRTAHCAAMPHGAEMARWYRERAGGALADADGVPHHFS